jgi:hypothetical protein
LLNMSSSLGNSDRKGGKPNNKLRKCIQPYESGWVKKYLQK